MGFLRRAPGGTAASGQTDTATEVAPVVVEAAIVGTLPCTQSRCAETNGAACAYVDRRGRACPTAWCPAHQIRDDDEVFCRRHRGVVVALRAAGEACGWPPDLDNRAPSLADWIGQALDSFVRERLAAMAPPERGISVVSHPLSVGMVDSIDRNRIRCWERSWHAADHTGSLCRVAVRVTDVTPDEVQILVDRTTVLRSVPPWIEGRKVSGHLSPDHDAAWRQDFDARMREAVTSGLESAMAAASRRPGMRPIG